MQKQIIGFEVYDSQAGFVCVKQNSNGSDNVVIFTPEQIPTLVKWLTEAAAELERRGAS